MLIDNTELFLQFVLLKMDIEIVIFIMLKKYDDEKYEEWSDLKN